ncbi:MAG: trehalase family glycosidase [Parcubacteria group bacterium]
MTVTTVKPELREIVHNILVNNRRDFGGHQYTVPSPESYPYQWFWDSCFHAIILTHFELDDAKKELRSLVTKQFENGLIPHIIYWEKNSILDLDWGVDGTSTLIQPPIIAYALYRIYEKDGDKKFLEEMYPSLVRYYRYLITRNSRENNLVNIINPDESGEDNSPRFDLPLAIAPKHSVEEHNMKRFSLFEENKKCEFDSDCMQKHFWVKDVAINTYMVENLEIMAKIAEELSRKEDAEFFRAKNELLKSDMRSIMFEDGVYWNSLGVEFEKIKVKTWAIFAPLVAGLYTKEEALLIVKKYLKDGKEFDSKYSLPTVSLSEESYSPDESNWGQAWEHPNWRGPVWMASNWFVYRGLKKYGFDEEAEKLRKISLNLIEKEGCREYYHPETGKGMGAQSFTWAGLVLDME